MNKLTLKEKETIFIDLNTLPEGVRYEKQYQRYWKVDKKTGKKIEAWRVDADTITYSGEYDLLTTTETFVGRNLGNNVQFLQRAIVQMLDKIDVLEQRIMKLEK